MSRLIPSRSASLYLTVGLAALAMAAQPAAAANLVGQSAFDLSAAGGGTLTLGGASANKAYSTSWDQTSKDLGTGKSCSIVGCYGSDLTLRTDGSVGVNVSATANAGTATLAFKQLNTTTLKATSLSNQYQVKASTATPVAASFTTTGASASVSVSGSLNYTDSLSAQGCLVKCDSVSQTLLSFGASNFPIVGMTTAGGGSVSVAGQKAPGAAGKSIPVKYGSVSFGAVGGLTSSNGTASRSDPALTESLNLLDLATNGSASALQGSVKLDKIHGVDFGTVSYNAGSATLNAIESLVQTSTMKVSSAIDTIFEDKTGAAISLLVKPSLKQGCHIGCLAPTPNAAGFYSIHDLSQLQEVAVLPDLNGFLLGDGSVSLAGDQIVTSTTYTVSFQELLGINLSGTVDLAALEGSAFGKSFGPIVSTELDLGGQAWTVYSHTFTETFVSQNTVQIPEPFIAAPGPVGLPGPAVPEPATWALMLVGFGAIGGAMRGQRYARFAA